MALNSYDASIPQGASAWQEPVYFAGDSSAGDINPEGAQADPFAYTSGSLLTPWEGRFNSSGYATGAYGASYQAPEFNKFNYADFNYAAPHVGQFEEKYADPAAFRFADFSGPSDFRAPTAEDMRADPGYQARMDAVKNAQVAGAAHGGVLRSGGFQKGLARAVGDQASQEYGNVYNRRASEHDRLRKEGESNYGINQGNTFQAFNTNTANRLQGYQTREGAWTNNANMALKEGELGYNIAQGTYDRNAQLARTQWQDQATQNEKIASAANQSAQSAASAASQNANAQYQRDLGDYTRARDEFWTNQDRQYAILDREANRGMQATGQYTNQQMAGYGAQADYSMGGANAQAAGTVNRGNAIGNGIGSAGNSAGGMIMYGGMNQQPSSSYMAPIGRQGQPLSGSYGSPYGTIGNPSVYSPFTGWAPQPASNQMQFGE